jgi:hypothetical protein
MDTWFATQEHRSLVLRFEKRWQRTTSESCFGVKGYGA